MTVKDIARVTHEAHRAYCRTLGDVSEHSWRFIPQWQREAAIKAVECHLAARARGETPGPSVSHESDSQQIQDHLFAAIVAVFAQRMTP